MVVPQVRSQTVKFYCTASSQEVVVGEQVDITYTVTNGDLSKFRFPKIDPALKLVYGPSTYSSYSYVNGYIETTKSYTYTLKAKSVGVVTIPPVTCGVNGKDAKCNALTIKVVEQKTSTPQNAPSTSVAPTPPKTGYSEPLKTENIDDKIRSRNFIVGTTDKKEYYVGEQITLQHKLYFLDEYTPMTVQKYPSVKGCFSYDLEGPNDNYVYTEKFQGVDYNTLLYAKSALFASIPGKYTIDPLIVDGVVEVMVGFDNFKLRKERPIILTSNTIPIVVKPLPTPPKGFSGGIGKFNIQAEIDNNEVKAGEPITLTYTVSGTGNIKLVDLSNPTFSKAFESFDPTIQENVSTASGIVAGTKKFQYILIPRVQGKQQLPATDFIYFDLEKKEYATIHLPEIVIDVKGSIQTTSSSTKSSKEKKIYGIKDGEIHAEQKAFFGSIGFIVLSIAPFLMFLGIFFIKRNRAQNETQQLSQKAIRQQLKILQTNIDEGSAEQFYISLSQLIRLFCAEQFNINTLEKTKESLEAEFLQKGVSSADTSEIMQILTTCEHALYAPQSKENTRKELYERTNQWMKKIEGNFKEKQ